MEPLGITGVARSGKDTFFSFIEDTGMKCKRLAFADELKQECLGFLLGNTNISPFTEDPEEKEIIRPFLVTYGTHVRRRLNPQCWIDKVSSRAEQLMSCGVTPIVTDVRYKNEADWIHDIGGKLIHVSRFNGKGNIEPANVEEEENDPLLMKAADAHVNWPTYSNIKMCKPIVEECLKNLQIAN